ncbi:syntaxin-binding protein tomosyn isoform X2 [Oratosquilla oratoria]|uniref:syntaxin-binding protein tomosyn isoform X2 n=1 Tax=Oratosquilla oratoria TaxID=337810 RepID=UPI003F7715E7
MKKFTRNVIDGFRSSVAQPTAKPEHVSIVETLRPEQFQVAKTVRHGFPYQPTAVAFDPIQKILAVGTKRGSIRIIGRPGVDVHVRHETEAAVLQLQFLLNEGALVTATTDDSLHLWNYRQKRPEIVHSLKFARERLTCMHLPFQSKWLYVGTERGNIHVVNLEVFQLSGYIVNWNKAIELSRKTHPGPVVHLSDCPIDPSKLLIGYESGQVVVWDLKNRAAEVRYQAAEPLKSVCWHYEGKQFMCSHTDGSLTTWAVKQTSPKPVSTIFPHAKNNKDGKQEPCKPIQKVEWKSSKTGETFVVFSGGLTNDRAGRTPSITVINGKTTTVLEMEHNVVDFITLCENPWPSELAEPYALVVLLHNDLVVVDLHTQGYPCFENPYAMDLHESPVTCCSYIADCPADVIPAMYSVGARSQKRAGFSEKEWPIAGGDWGSKSCSYAEMIITGHADGSIKFWDASSVSLQVLYKLKTAKVFEKPRTRSIDGDEDPFAIQHISLCPESRLLCVAGATVHLILFKYCKQETYSEVPCLEIPIVYEVCESGDCSPEYEYPPRPTLQVASKQHNISSSGDSSDKKFLSQNHNRRKAGASLDYFVPIHVRGGAQKKAPGYQADLVCLTPWVDGEPPSQISAVTINSSYGLISYGNESGLVIIDYIQKTCLLNMGTPELYGDADPYQRVPRSPKRAESSNAKEEERSKSPSSSDQDCKEGNSVFFIGQLSSDSHSEAEGDHKKRHPSRSNSRGKSDGDLLKRLVQKDSKGKKKRSQEKIDLDHIPGLDDIDMDVNIGFQFPKCSLKKEGKCVESDEDSDNTKMPSDTAGDTGTTVLMNSEGEEDKNIEKKDLEKDADIQGESKSKSDVEQTVLEGFESKAETKKQSRFSIKDQFSKLDARFRRAFSLENSHNMEDLHISNQEIIIFDDDGEMKEKVLEDVLEDDVDQAEDVIALIDQMNSSTIDEFSKVQTTLKPSPKVTPLVSPRVSPKGSPGVSPKPSPRPSPLEEMKVLEEHDLISEGSHQSHEDRKSSLTLFDKDGNPVPPPRRKVRLGETKQSRSKGSLFLEQVKESTPALSVTSSESSVATPSDVRKEVTPNEKQQQQLAPGQATKASSVTSPSSIVALKSFVSHITKKSSTHSPHDKLDGSFSRSRSSSISSLDNISSEAITCLAFADSYTRKSDTQTCPTLWVGTSLGSIIQVILSIPSTTEARQTSSVVVSPSGTIFRLKGSILAMSFLDCNGALIPYAYESWRDANREGKKLERTPTKSLMNNRMSPTNSGEQWGDRQFVAFASEKVARVVALPSQNCVYKQIITEASFVIKADIVQYKDSVCLVCYVATGHISIFSLPSLRQLLYIDFLPLVDLSFQTRKTGIVDPMLSIWGQQIFVNEDTDQIARTFCFTNFGHGMYLCSPSEIQKFTISLDFCKDLQELLGELYVACDMPEPPKQSFFKGLFGGAVSQFDREELFGDSSGKGSRSVAKHIPGPTTQLDALNMRAGTLAGEVNRTKMLLVERGQKLGDLEDKSGKMMTEAEAFSTVAHKVMLKYKDKKWYQL